MIREYRESDLALIKKLHAKQGFTYDMPDLNDPVFLLGAVSDDGAGAAFVKVVGEAYFFLDPEHGQPIDRWETFLNLHHAIRDSAQTAGLSEVGCVIPPEVPKSFHRRLNRLGWQDEPEDWKRKAFHIRKVTL